MGRQPEEFILIVGRNETMARQRMSEIRNVLERNPMIRADFGDLVGDVWGEERDGHQERHSVASAGAWLVSSRFADWRCPTDAETV